MPQKSVLRYGDVYEQDVYIRDIKGLLDMGAVTSVEFTFGTVRKLYPQDVSYSVETGLFTVPFSYDEAKKIEEDAKWQARVVFFNGDVKGTYCYTGRLSGGIAGTALYGRHSEPPYSDSDCCGVRKNGKLLVKGDTYNLPVILKMNGDILRGEDVEHIDFWFGALRKEYPLDVSYNEETGEFIVPMKQEETYGFAQEVPYRAVVTFSNDEKEKTAVQTARVEMTLSREVL